ncbi:ABC transporter permease [Actinocrispum sp. NPDC049592]|uniref:ABC transporter permease n=1 Tax=Actinocrispum sp. NPDC049592 TaxID=3154835 RepID=UPI00343B6E40
MTSFAAATRLIAEREIRTMLRLKGFWIGFAVVLAGLFAVAILPTVFGGGKPSVAAVGSSAAAVLTGADLDVRQVDSRSAAEDLVRAEDVDAAVVSDGSGVRVVALSDPPVTVIAALHTAPPVDLLAPAAVSHGARTVVIQAFALVFFVFGMGGAAVAQGTVSEKQTRVVEILVSTIPVRAMLAGKIIGHSLLTIGQAVLLIVAAPLALRLGGHTELLAMTGPALGWFVPFLCLGFVLLTALWAVAGSMVSRQEDLGSSMSLVMLLLLGPYLGVLMASDNEIVLTVLSYVPFSAAIAMPVRMFTGDAQAWEALVALGLLAGTTVLIVLFASRLYSGSLLHTRGKLALTTAWKQAEN